MRYFERNADVPLETFLTDWQAHCLALYVKRAYYEHVAHLAEDESQTRGMMSAIIKVQEALEDKG